MSRSVRIATASILLLANADQASARVPNISLDWVGVYEMSTCAKSADQPRYLRARAEAERRLPEFQEIWAKEGPRLLKTAQEITGQPFRYEEAIAVLQVCEEQQTGISHPLLINAKWFLEAYDGKYRTHPLWRETFVELMFHEILHRYIRDALGPGEGEPFRSTKLMQRYSNEQLMTRTHLHLFAIERAVYNRVGRNEIIGMTRDYGKEWPAYVRAHQIVDELGAEAVLADFKTAAQERRQSLK